MFCDEVLDTIELIAAGELTTSARIADHLSSCPGCSRALAAARRVDALLRSRATPAPPANFSSRVMNHMRRARWRSEQLVDWGFNIALVTVGMLVVFGLWIVMRQSGLATVSNDAIEMLGPGMVLFARRISPSLPLYAAATALLGTALALWWWAERDAAL
jgi:anti-sigma factor (TIGR02949 family)